MNKKAIAILGAIFLLIVGTLGFLIYSKYGGKSQTPPATENPDSNQVTSDNNPAGGDEPGDEPVVPDQNNAVAVFKLTDDQVVSPVLFFNGTGITYFNRQGQLFQSSLEENNGQLSLTRKKTLDIPIKPDINKILWPARGDNFIAEFIGSDGKKTWSFYDSSIGAYADLPPQIFSVDWLPSGDSILYVWLEDGKATMNQGNPDTTNWQTISEMWELDDSLHVSPDGKNVLYYEESNTTAINYINQTTPDGKLWKGLVKTGFNYGVLWSPDGQKFLFGKKDQDSQKFQLWYYDLTTGEVRNTGLLTTTDKAVWDKDSTVFYASVPLSGTAGNGSLTVDSFFKVDSAAFSQTEYQTGDVEVDGRDLFLSLDSTKLFFKNAQDGGLYYLDLNQ